MGSGTLMRRQVCGEMCLMFALMDLSSEIGSRFQYFDPVLWIRFCRAISLYVEDYIPDGPSRFQDFLDERAENICSQWSPRTNDSSHQQRNRQRWQQAAQPIPQPVR